MRPANTVTDKHSLSESTRTRENSTRRRRPRLPGIAQHPGPGPHRTAAARPATSDGLIWNLPNDSYLSSPRHAAAALPPPRLSSASFLSPSTSVLV